MFDVVLEAGVPDEDSKCDRLYDYRLIYAPKPSEVGLLKQKAKLDVASMADWESAFHDAVEAVTGLAVCDADDTIYSAVGGNCATNCNLKYGASAGTCTTIKSGDAAWKDKYADRAVEAAGWTNVHVLSAQYEACQYAPEVGTAGLKLEAPSLRPTVAAPTRVPTSKPTETPNATPAPSYKPSTTRTGIPTGVPTTPPSKVPTVQPSIAPTFETWAPSAVPTSKPTRVPSPAPSPKPSAKPTFKPTPQSAKSFPPTPRPVTPTLRPTPMPSKVPVPAPTAPPSAAPTSFPSLTPTASQAPTRKGSITWAHVGEDIEVRGLGMHKFTANADNSVMFFFAGYHDDCDDGARAAKMAADPPTNDAAWNNASYCLYPNGNGISAGRWPPDCWPTYDKKGKCSNQDRECDVAEDCNRKAWR